MSEQPFAPKPGPRAPVPGAAVPGPACLARRCLVPAWAGCPAGAGAGVAVGALRSRRPRCPRLRAARRRTWTTGRPRVDPSAGTSSGDAAGSGRGRGQAEDQRARARDECRPTQARASDREPTGDAAVDQALDLLDSVSGESLDRHIEVGQQVHRTLQARLADLGRE